MLAFITDAPVQMPSTTATHLFDGSGMLTCRVKVSLKHWTLCARRSSQCQQWLLVISVHFQCQCHIIHCPSSYYH